MKMIKYSEHESKLYNLKIGRTDRIETLNNEQILSEINTCNYDMIKMKVSLEERTLFNKLNRLPFFYEHYNIITHQKRKIIPHEILEIDSNIEFELYKGELKEELKIALYEMLINDSVFYDSDLSGFIKNDSKYINNSIEYFLSLNHAINPSVYLFIGRLNNQIAGLCSFKRIENNEAEGIIYGIIPKYRDKKLAQSFLNFAIKSVSNEKFDFFNTEVLALTYKSLYPHIRSQFKPVGIYANLTLYPMLNIKNVISRSSISNLWENVELFIKNNFKLKTFKVKNEIVEMKGNLMLFYSLNCFDLHYLGYTNKTCFFKITEGNNFVYFKIYLC